MAVSYPSEPVQSGDLRRRMARALGLPPDSPARDVLRAVEAAINSPDAQEELAQALGLAPETPVGQLLGRVRTMLDDDERPSVPSLREQIERRVAPRYELAEKAKRICAREGVDFATALSTVVAREPDLWLRAQRAYADRDLDDESAGVDPREALAEAARDIVAREHVPFTEALARARTRHSELSEAAEQHYRL